MIYIHRMQNPLSSNLAFAALFGFDSPEETHTLPLNQRNPPDEKQISARLYFDRIARRPGLSGHHDVHDLSGFFRNDAAGIWHEGHEQHATDRNGVANIPQR